MTLSNVKEQKMLLQGLPGKLVYTHDPAYMDDLITPSGTQEALQKKEDIISFLIFGVYTEILKMRSYIAN